MVEAQLRQVDEQARRAEAAEAARLPTSRGIGAVRPLPMQRAHMDHNLNIITLPIGMFHANFVFWILRTFKAVGNALRRAIFMAP